MPRQHWAGTLDIVVKCCPGIAGGSDVSSSPEDCFSISCQMKVLHCWAASKRDPANASGLSAGVESGYCWAAHNLLEPKFVIGQHIITPYTLKDADA